MTSYGLTDREPLAAGQALRNSKKTRPQEHDYAIVVVREAIACLNVRYYTQRFSVSNQKK
jgi:hypothetical protein